MGLNPAENVVPAIRTEVVEAYGDDLVALLDSVLGGAHHRGPHRDECTGRPRPGGFGADRRGVAHREGVHWA